GIEGRSRGRDDGDGVADLVAIRLEDDTANWADAGALRGDFGGDGHGSANSDAGCRGGGDGRDRGRGRNSDGLAGRAAAVEAVVATVEGDDAVDAYTELDRLIFDDATAVEFGGIRSGEIVDRLATVGQRDGAGRAGSDMGGTYLATDPGDRNLQDVGRA